MKTILLHGAILGGALAISTAAHATTFSYDDRIDTYTVATTGTYTITATGAAGGAIQDYAYPGSGYGGEGAQVQGTFSLTAGTILDIIVGQQGALGWYGGGGGGGSFVVTSTGTPLAIAGGGGGGGYYATGNADASTSTSGLTAYYYSAIYGNGGTAGSGGQSDFGGGGGGLLTDGINNEGYSYGYDYGYGGSAFVNGGAGGAGDYDGSYDGAGGFGGGAGGGYYGGGGGGGYSGGGGGGEYSNGGGGGSYLDPSAVDPLLTADASPGNGQVTISPVPEPASLMMLTGAISLLGLVRRRKRLAAPQA